MLLSGCLRWLGFGTWVWGGVGEEFKEYEEFKEFEEYKEFKKRRGSNGVMIWEKCTAAFLARLRPAS
jgi:hypothetical protein